MRFLPVLAVFALAGCMGATRASKLEPSTLTAEVRTVEESRAWPAWPPGYEPHVSSVFVRNAVFIHAPPERVYAWLVRARGWPAWFPKMSRVRYESGGPRLEPGSKLAFRMLGTDIRVTVAEAEPGRRLAWQGGGKGVHAYHAWLLEPERDGTLLVTEETEHAGVSSFFAGYIRHALKDAHQTWIERLAKVAESGEPPE